MKRTTCGGFFLASLVALGGCSGDPTGDLVGSGLAVHAEPTSLFMAQGEQKTVTVSVLDAQGNEQDLSGFSFTPGAGISVVEDTTYLVTTNGGQLGTSRRLFVEGIDPTATSVELLANGQSLTVPVKVTPTSTTITVSNPAPAANEPMTITLPAGYKFGTGAGANINGAAGAVVSVAADSSSIDILLPPGASGPVTVDSVQVDYAPGVLFSLPTADAVTVGAVTPLAGTGSPATAPAVTVQPIGGTTVFFDGGTFDYGAPIFGGEFGNFPSRLYSITVADTTTLDVTLDWPSPEDLGIYVFASNGTTETGDAADDGGAGVHPEHGTFVFPPGSYRLAVVNFNATNPAYFALTVTTLEPEE